MAHTVLVTGGTRGIGKACCEKFLKKGYNVIATYVSNEEKASMMMAEHTGENFIAAKCDVSDYESVKALFGFIGNRYGGVDVLVNNAGISMQKMLCDTTRDDWERIMNVNVGAMYNTVNCATPYMVNKKYGKIVNVSSIWGICGASCEVAYSASKAAVIGFTKALAKELGPSGICVNCVAPGVIDTEMNAAFDDETMEALSDETPLCRIGTPQEVADTVCFLSSDESSFITGQVISPNGGIVI